MDDLGTDDKIIEDMNLIKYGNLRVKVHFLEDDSRECLGGDVSCLGSRTPGVKDTPFLGSVWGAKEAGKRLPPGDFIYARDLCTSKHHKDTRSLPRFRPPGG